MDNLTEIKVKLDDYYQAYKKNNKLNVSNTKAVAEHIVEIASQKDGNPHDVAVELARFSVEVTNEFFSIIKNTIPTETLDLFLKELQATYTDAKLSQYYVSKYAFAIESIMEYYKENAFKIAAIPQLVVFIARFAIKSDKNKNKFCKLINNTSGRIFMLDYSGINRNSLVNIWDAVNKVYLDVSKKHSSLIVEWAKKYDFIKEDVTVATTIGNRAVKIEGAIVSNEASDHIAKPTDVTASANDSKSKPVAKENEEVSSDRNTDKVVSDVPIHSNEDINNTGTKQMSELDEKKSSSVSSVSIEKEFQAEITDKELYVILKQDISAEKEAIITAFTDMVAPIGKALGSIQGEINKSREIGAENLSLKTKIEDLERQLSEQSSRLQDVNYSLMTAETENNKLKKQISDLESQNSELDSKLKDAYTINSRESSLEAEKIRSELKKAFAFLYEDWLEYEFSDVSEDNYKSLQAIIKKIFRSLERNGIDFKGND